ncbi:MAG: M1 family aminopeptidase, partial [Gammaproteobacteria bacterium]
MADRPEADTSGSPRTVYLQDYQAPAYWVDQVELTFDLDAEQTVVSAALHCRRNPEVASEATPLQLQGQRLQLQEVRLEGRLLAASEYTCTDEQLTLHSVPAAFILQTVVTHSPGNNTALEGLYQSGPMLCTQCEAEGFRRITYFPDRPDVMSRYTVTLRADKGTYPVLLANGNPVERGELDNGRHYVTWQDPSLKPSYLFAIVAGPLLCQEDRFTTLSGREVLLQIYVEAENIHKCDHALVSLKQAMQWDEAVYDREYDLDIFMIVAVNDFNMGAMENKGLNIFNAACVLASP